MGFADVVVLKRCQKWWQWWKLELAEAVLSLEPYKGTTIDAAGLPAVVARAQHPSCPGTPYPHLIGSFPPPRQ